MTQNDLSQIVEIGIACVRISMSSFYACRTHSMYLSYLLSFLLTIVEVDVTGQQLGVRPLSLYSPQGMYWFICPLVFSFIQEIKNVQLRPWENNLHFFYILYTIILVSPSKVKRIWLMMIINFIQQKRDNSDFYLTSLWKTYAQRVHVCCTIVTFLVKDGDFNPISCY